MFHITSLSSPARIERTKQATRDLPLGGCIWCCLAPFAFLTFLWGLVLTVAYLVFAIQALAVGANTYGGTCTRQMGVWLVVFGSLALSAVVLHQITLPDYHGWPSENVFTLFAKLLFLATFGILCWGYHLISNHWRDFEACSTSEYHVMAVMVNVLLWGSVALVGALIFLAITLVPIVWGAYDAPRSTDKVFRGRLDTRSAPATPATPASRTVPPTAANVTAYDVPTDRDAGAARDVPRAEPRPTTPMENARGYVTGTGPMAAQATDPHGTYPNNVYPPPPGHAIPAERAAVTRAVTRRPNPFSPLFPFSKTPPKSPRHAAGQLPHQQEYPPVYNQEQALPPPQQQQQQQQQQPQADVPVGLAQRAPDVVQAQTDSTVAAAGATVPTTYADENDPDVVARI